MRLAPETATTPNTVADSTSIVPRSGWSRISAAGSPAIASMPTTSKEPTSLVRSEPSVRSATSSAIPMTTASLANSAGWIDMPPSRIHDRDPLMVVAHDEHQHQSDHRGDVHQRREDAHPAVVGGGHHHPEHDTDRDVDEVLLEVAARVAVGEVVARGGRGPHQERADREQGSNGEHQQPVEPGGLDAGRRGAGQRGTSLARAPGADGDDAHRFVAFSARASGGRIEPSRAKIGRPPGGWRPGIAALSAFTFMPLMP